MEKRKASCPYWELNLGCPAHKSKKVKMKMHKVVILCLVLCGCETWPFTLSEEHRLRVFENRMLRIFGLKGEEAAEGWRKLHNGELHNLCPIKVNKIGRTYCIHGREEK
jgi:hypothetical protein